MYMCKHKMLEVGENSVEKARLKYLKELKEPREDFLFIPGLKSVERIACNMGLPTILIFGQFPFHKVK